MARAAPGRPRRSSKSRTRATIFEAILTFVDENSKRFKILTREKGVKVF